MPYWLPDGRLLSEGPIGLHVWDVEKGTSRRLRPCRAALNTSDGVFLSSTPDGKTIVSLIEGTSASGSRSDLTTHEVASATTREITTHGTRVSAMALDPTGTILVTGDFDGLVRVGPLAGGEPHLLYGHSRAITGVAVAPDGRWIASGSDDGTIRLWPMPAGPPLHTLPHDVLLAKLRSLTNLRVVPDSTGPTGHKLEPGPFPGWSDAPVW